MGTSVWSKKSCTCLWATGFFTEICAVYDQCWTRIACAVTISVRGKTRARDLMWPCHNVPDLWKLKSIPKSSEMQQQEWLTLKCHVRFKILHYLLCKSWELGTLFTSPFSAAQLRPMQFEESTDTFLFLGLWAFFFLVWSDGKMWTSIQRTQADRRVGERVIGNKKSLREKQQPTIRHETHCANWEQHENGAHGLLSWKWDWTSLGFQFSQNSYDLMVDRFCSTRRNQQNWKRKTAFSQKRCLGDGCTFYPQWCFLCFTLSHQSEICL